MTPEQYGDNYRDHYLEQYKLCVEMADRVTQRKEQTNRLYVTLFSALMAAFSFAMSSWPNDLRSQMLPWLPIVVGLVGVLLAAAWLINVSHLRRELILKERIIREMESSLTFEAFKTERQILKQEPYGYLFRVVSSDVALPVIFFGISITLYGTSFLWLQ